MVRIFQLFETTLTRYKVFRFDGQFSSIGKADILARFLLILTILFRAVVVATIVLLGEAVRQHVAKVLANVMVVEVVGRLARQHVAVVAVELQEEKRNIIFINILKFNHNDNFLLYQRPWDNTRRQILSYHFVESRSNNVYGISNRWSNMELFLVRLLLLQS